MSNPYLEIKDKAMEISSNYIKTYDYIPDVKPPFCFFDNQVNFDIYTKDRTLGITKLNIHIYAYPEEYNHIVEIMDNILAGLYNNPRTPNYGFRIVDSDSSVIVDDQGDVPLRHGILNIRMEYK